MSSKKRRVVRSDYDSGKIYLRDIDPIPQLNQEQESKLFEELQQGDETVVEKIIHANLKLVVKIAQKYAYFGVPFMDLVEEGNLGLIRAVKKFDLSRGFRFATYASWWIRQYITRALANQGKTIRLPAFMIGRIARVEEAIMRIRDRKHRRPSIDEIAKETKLPRRKVLEVFSIARRTHSLNALITDELDSMAVLADRKATDSGKAAVEAELREKVASVLRQLKGREKDILLKRFELEGKKPETLKELAAEYNVSRERIRQIEQAALRKLKKILKEEHIDKYEDLSSRP